MITELKPTTLIAVKVPDNTSDYGYDKHRGWIHATVTGIDFEADWFSYKLPLGEYKILGEVSKDKIGFDVEPYLIPVYKGIWHNYIAESLDDAYDCITKEESFYSLLKANGLKKFKKLLIIEKI